MSIPLLASQTQSLCGSCGDLVLFLDNPYRPEYRSGARVYCGRCRLTWLTAGVQADLAARELPLALTDLTFVELT